MTRVLVATQQTQGFRASDFCFVPEGELLYYGVSCDRDGNDPDGPCGCLRSLCGVIGHQGTTTAMVQEVAMSHDTVLARYADAYVDAGFTQIWSMVEAMHRRLLDLAAAYPVGTIIERRGEELLIVRAAA